MKGLGQSAIEYYNDGYNCSQCILMAFSKVYNRKISKDVIDLCGAVNNGFGTGCICSVLVACVMVFGLMYDDADAKNMRMMLFDKFVEKYNCLNCAVISANGCDEVILYACTITEELIENN